MSLKAELVVPTYRHRVPGNLILFESQVITLRDAAGRERAVMIEGTLAEEERIADRPSEQEPP